MVDCIILPAISIITSEQASVIEKTKQTTKHLLDYLTAFSNAKVHVYASKTIRNVHSDAFYLLFSDEDARKLIYGFENHIFGLLKITRSTTPPTDFCWPGQGRLLQRGG